MGGFALTNSTQLKWNQDLITCLSQNCWVTLSLWLISRFLSFLITEQSGWVWKCPKLAQRKTIGGQPIGSTVGTRSCINSTKMVSLKLPHDSRWSLFFLFAASMIPRFIVNLELENERLSGDWDKSLNLRRSKYVDLLQLSIKIPQKVNLVLKNIVR